MLPAVQFDDQPCFVAQEIDDEWADRRLPPKFEATKSAPSQRQPERAFDVGHIAAKARGVGTDLTAKGMHG